MQKEEIVSMLSHALDSRAQVRSRALDGFANAFVYQLNDTGEGKRRKKGDQPNKGDWVMEFTASGEERPYGRKVERGKVYSVTPQMLEMEMTRTLTPVDTRTSTKVANLDYAMRLKGAEAATHDEYLELMGKEDVSSWKEDWNADKDFEALDPKLDVLATSDFAAFMSLETGRAYEEVLMLVSGVGMPQSFSPQPMQPPNTMTVTPPPSDQNTIAAETGQMGAMV